MQKTGKLRSSLRIILVITGKDILDSVRNKTILSLLVTALFLSAFFTIMPKLSDSGSPLVFLSDSGDSSSMSLLTRSDAFRLRTYPSTEKMKADFIQRADNQIALVLPADFDQTLASGGIPRIQGYVLNWVNSKTIAEKKDTLQTKLTSILGSPVQIDMNGGTLFMSPESNGGLLEATGIVIILITTGMSLVPNLFLEEKRTRTMEALQVSPANSNQIAISKTLTGVFYVAIFAALVMAANAYLVLHWSVAVWSILLSILVSVSIGLLLGILIENRQQIIITSQVLLIPLILPILLRIFSDLLPGWLTDIIRWFPSAAMFDLLRISFSNRSDPSMYLPRMGILAICFIGLFGISARLIRRVER